VCGIDGFNFKDESLIKKMMAVTSSRGPDNQDYFASNEYTVGHNRLSIIDPDKRSNQPYYFKNFVLSFNGEIYNYLEIKKILISKGYSFKTNSDTEVIIKLFDLEGKNSFKKLSGIFSISIYDLTLKKLYLVRDIVGVKPLYYHFESDTKKFIFSSLINSILIYMKNKQLNHDAINSYSNFNRNDYRETFFKNIFKVLPGELIEISNGNYKRTKLLNFKFKTNKNENEINNDINKNFSNQFLSDVPVALSLSGGVDSNILFQELLKNKGTNFTNYSVTFKDSKNHQQDHDVAKKISRHYGVKFNSIEVSSQDFRDNAEKIIDITEEPTGNQNAISNLILSNNISEKVLFSGDGGDEVFTGYNRYKSIYILSLFIKSNLFKNIDFKTKNKNINRLSIKDSRNLYLSFGEQNLFRNAKNVYKDFKLINNSDLDQILNHSLNLNNHPNLSNVMFHDLDTWLPNDILVRNDKIYGNKGIEARVPFLDKQIIEDYLMIKDSKKYGLFFKSKNILLKNYKGLNKFILKKKIGFLSPFSGWLRKEIYEFGKEILSKQYYDSSDIIDLDFSQKLLNKHREGYCDPYLIWNLISLQIFLKKYKF
jgi:asparagine synthase (glutamine-hydrolysing)